MNNNKIRVSVSYNMNLCIFNSFLFQSISPGVVETDFFHAASFLEEGVKIGDNLPALRSEDISNAIIFLLTTDYHVNITEMTVKPVGEPF